MESKNFLGRIHSFESFGTVDGPGIRFVIFMQGCHLKCKYCQNRDTWDTYNGNLYSVDTVIEMISRSKPFIESSKGGVTISGGEPLLQIDFLIELLKRLKELNYHTAIDTAGSIVITGKLKELLNYTDLILLDIKHIDNDKCKELTGLSNDNTLSFAKYCSDNNKDLWIRQVLIPGITDDENDLKRTSEFIHSLKTVKKIEVLPYHNLGKFKWTNLGFEYPLESVSSPSIDEINKAYSILSGKDVNS